MKIETARNLAYYFGHRVNGVPVSERVEQAREDAEWAATVPPRAVPGVAPLSESARYRAALGIR